MTGVQTCALPICSTTTALPITILPTLNLNYPTSVVANKSFTLNGAVLPANSSQIISLQIGNLTFQTNPDSSGLFAFQVPTVSRGLQAFSISVLDHSQTVASENYYILVR